MTKLYEVILEGTADKTAINHFNVKITYLQFRKCTKAEVFYNVNYVNVNFSVKNSTVDCKYLLFLQIKTKTLLVIPLERGLDLRRPRWHPYYIPRQRYTNVARGGSRQSTFALFSNCFPQLGISVRDRTRAPIFVNMNEDWNDLLSTTANIYP